MFSAFPFLVSTGKTHTQKSQDPETSRKVYNNKGLPLVKEDQLKEHLNKLEIRKSRGPDGIYPHVLRELADVIARSLSIVSERLW